ncbi:MAG: chitobiase/beta-hexosaminidase C-terminal domain-containing protein [Prevotella sp.]|nr:chitobiase/beta-hexosaminidase C-terminal domain-containing protein [Prevotella sp.]
MAKSSTYFGLRRGSTKTQTFSVVGGKQITKDRVEGGKDPRTLSQMSQRCMVATIGTAYSAMKGICDHSFEGLSAGMSCMREFMSSNLRQIRISKDYDNGFFGFSKYKQAGLVPGSYIISKGSLPVPLVDAEIESVNVADKNVSLNLVPATNGTIAEVAEAMGCKFFGDMCTIAIMYPKADGSYGFGAVRFTYMSGASVLESFSVAYIGDVASVTPSFAATALKAEIHLAYGLATDATADNTYMVSITSRKVNGSWLRSNAQFDVTDATPSFGAAISTYPVGQERFLNGSDVNVAASSGSQDSGNGSQNSGSGSQNSGSEQSGSGSQQEQQNTLEKPTISGVTPFTESTEVTMSGPEDAEIRYTTDGSTPTAQSTLYEGGFTLSDTTTVKAIAIKNGESSEVSTKLFSKGTGDEPGGSDH